MNAKRNRTTLAQSLVILEAMFEDCKLEAYSIQRRIDRLDRALESVYDTDDCPDASNIGEILDQLKQAHQSADECHREMIRIEALIGYRENDLEDIAH